jgi:two-component system OmpR family response regulator/two-component system response regulator RstA
MLPPERKHILLVEDDPSLSVWMSDYLSDHDFDVTVANRGDVAVELIRGDMPDLVVLDIMLPQKSGFDVCREVRAFYPHPILIITAGTEETDEVLGLELGADDYLCKPLKPRILLARINALLRRGYEPVNLHVRSFGPLRIDALSKTVSLGEKVLDFSVNEFDMLWLLASRAGEVVSRHELIGRFRGIDYDGFDRSMDIRISRLRKKLEEQPEQPVSIKTVRGKGYLFSPNPR